MGVPEYATLGRRIETRDGARATVRYVGSVDGQDGEWVGVEWDDPARGKHDGSHDGKRYFECKETGLEPGALPASFVRAHKIRPSVTFAAAIRAKYLDGKGEIAKVPKTRAPPPAPTPTPATARRTCRARTGRRSRSSCA